MPITYTNRKGRTYYLCQGVTKTGKPRYLFAREPRYEPVHKIPPGYEIRESVNGVVSLARVTPAVVRAEELAAVEAALWKHPKAQNYRVAVKHKRIVVYERAGPDVDEYLSELEGYFPISPRKREAGRELLEKRARFDPVMRFTLWDKERRTFHAERWCFRGSIDGWLSLHLYSTVAELAQDLIPALGTDEFFELW